MTNHLVEKKSAFIVRWEKEEAKGIYHLVSEMENWLMDILWIHVFFSAIAALVFTGLCFVPVAGMSFCWFPAFMCGVSFCFGLWATSKASLVLGVIKSLDIQSHRSK